MEIKIARSIRIQPETYLRLKILSVAMQMSIGNLMTTMVNQMWESKSDMVSKRVDGSRVKTELNRMLNAIVKS